jgi:hypothetical protein
MNGEVFREYDDIEQLHRHLLPPGYAVTKRGGSPDTVRLPRIDDGIFSARQSHVPILSSSDSMSPSRMATWPLTCGSASHSTTERRGARERAPVPSGAAAC